MKKTITAIISSSLAISVSTFTNSALAQTASNNAIEEIVVTSRKRSENLQQIPDSITVFNSDQIERAGISDITDFAAFTPNLSAYGNFRPNLTNITIRGLTSTQLGEPPIAFVVDGITVNNLEFINQGLIDIERIEVIRGSQGALYGKNAIGGAINIVTKAPSEDTAFVVKAAYGSGSDKRLNGSVSGTANDSVVYRFSAFYRDFDGLIEDSFTGQESDFVEEAGVQGLLGFNFSEQTYVDLRFRYSQGDYGVGYYDNVAVENLSSDVTALAQNVLPVDENTLFNISAKLEHETDYGSFIVVAGFNESEDNNFLDSDFSTLEPDFINLFTGAQTSFIEDSAFTFESRFTSNDNSALKWLAGVYYQDRERVNNFDIIDDSNGTVLVPNAAALAGEFVSEIVRDNQQSSAYALFGQANYDVTDSLELTLGLRYDSETREGVDPRDPTTFEEQTFDELQPKFSIAWQATDSLLAYASYARGFRSGGFNEVAPGIQRSFDAEVSDTVEFGFKSTLIANILGINASYFITDQDNAQFTRFNATTFSLEQLSINNVDISGFEFEGWWRPTESLHVQANFGIIDNEIQSFDAAIFPDVFVDIVGNTIPRVADFNANLSFTYSQPISDDLTLVTNLSGNWLGERFFDIENDFSDNGLFYLTASIGVESEQWVFQVRGSNLTDQFEPEDAFFGSLFPLVARFRNQPQQIVAEFTYRF